MDSTDAPNARVVFYEDQSRGEPVWLSCHGLVDVLQAQRPDEVISVLSAVQRAADAGLYAAGFVTYEAAQAMDEAYATHPRGELPLAWFGLFREFVRQEQTAIRPNGGICMGDWQPSITPGQYDDAVGRIKQYIAKETPTK